ncbi:MAG: Trp biosynthesis-associated membrane protein [Micropruina sp.]|uniref:Trp biosynthesis-associated membrane protein n=1 Tax=Micropruina sp. TaxID=2737536 RepID=UPI0039E3FF04
MRRLATVLLWLGCAAALLGATQPWWSAGERTAASGGQATSGAAVALMLAAAAGAFLGSWLRSIGRRIVLGLVAVLAVGSIVVAITATVPTLPGSTLGDALALVATPWRWVYLAGAVLVAVGAVLVQFAGPPPARTASAPNPGMDAWKALDAGEDPT